LRIICLFKNIFGDIMSIFTAVKRDLEMYVMLDPSVEKKWEVLVASVGFYAMMLYRISNLLWRWKLKFLALIVYAASRIITGVDIHPAARIEPGVVIDHGMGTVIGSTAGIGSGTIIYHGVTLGARRIESGKRHPDIGRNVFIGSGAKVLGAVKVGDGARIGANAVVLNDVPAGAVAVGVPARILEKKQDNPEQVEVPIRIHGI